MTAAHAMGNVTSLSQALTMSLTSTSSESDNDFLEMCRASTLLAELEDDDELPEAEDETDDNEDDNKDDEEYDDVLVSEITVDFFAVSIRTACLCFQLIFICGKVVAVSNFFQNCPLLCD